MAAIPVNLQIVKGTDFEKVFTLTNSDGSARDLTGYTGISSIGKYPTDSTKYSFTVGITSSTGKVTISMARSDTANLKDGRNYYDVVLVSSASTYTQEVTGSAIVSESSSA